MHGYIFSHSRRGRAWPPWLVIGAVFSLLVASLPAGAVSPVPHRPDTAPGYGVYRGVSTAVRFDISPPLRDNRPLEVKPGGYAEIPERATGLEGPLGPQDADAAVQTSYGPGLIPAPIVSFDGPNNISNVSPPDPVGDVGPNHYVAMSNLSFQIFDKTGNSLYGPALNNTLWAGFGGDCQTDNSGDPIVLHDQIADRWMLSQFTASGPTYFNCVAVSTTADPTGSYYRWAFSTGSNFPDYPKYGWWSDALYISTRDFAGGSTFVGIGAYAVKRSDLISGNPAAQVISFLVSPASAGGAYNIGDGLLPSDLDGSTLPPAGSPNYYMGSMDNGGSYGAPQDALTLWKFTADFVTPANSSFVLANTIPIASYDTIFPCWPTSRNCIPQPGTTNKIDILSYRQRPMHRLAYRNFGTHESLVTNQSVEAATNMAGIRWWEVRSPNSNPVLYQDSTYAPGTQDTIHRWMGSIAMDNAGNMALGYSASNGTTTYPSSWYTGRLAADPLNTMPQGEGSIINGTGSQTGSGRWGDYTSMNVDPVDDCTFWYVNQWIPSTSSNGWQLRIGAFKFNQCGEPKFTLAVTPPAVNVCAPADANYTVIVDQVSGFTSPVTLGTTGTPAGATTNFSVNPVTPPGSSNLTMGTEAVAAGNYTFDVTGDSTTGHRSVTVGLNVATAPGAPTLLTPANGALNVPTTPTFTWNAVAGATSYSIQVATDAAFTNIVRSASDLISPTWTSNVDFNISTIYYWRVKAGNTCGTGAWSAVFLFTTQNVRKVWCTSMRRDHGDELNLWELSPTPVIPADPNPGSGSIDVLVMYANDSGPSTTVLAQYYNPDGGSPAGTRQQQLGPLASYQFRASDSGLPDNWVGSMVLSASSELAATATIQWSGAPLGDGREADTYTGFGSGSSQMNIPYLVYAPNAQYSVVSVQNTEANTTANITMRYFNRNGGLDFTITDQIPALGQKMYDMHVPGTKIPVWIQSAHFQANGTWTGSMVITTSGSDQKVAAINNNFWPRYSVAYNGSIQGARRLFLPSIERRYTDPNTENGWLGFSLTTVQNLGTGPTNVTIKYINKDTGNVDLSIGPISLNAGVAVGCNTRSGGTACVDQSMFNVLGSQWAGSVIVESTSQDVAAVNFSIRPRDNEAGGYTGAATVFAGTKNFLPEVYQIGGSGNSRTQWSLIRIQNVTDQTANVEVKFVNRDGTTAATRNLTIGGEKSSNFNLRTDDQVNLGGNWTGAVYINSNQPLVAVVENLWGLQRLATYNSYTR